MSENKITTERLKELFGWAEAQILQSGDRWKFADVATAISELCARRAMVSPMVTEEMVKALKAFAAIADEYSDQEDDDFQVWKDFDVLGSTLPLHLFRNARAALIKADHV